MSATRQAWTQATARELRRRATASEGILWEHLRGRRLGGYRFRRQQPIGPYVVDFFCPVAGLIVEIDGAVHDQQPEYDLERQAELEGAGYRVQRFSVDRVIQDLNAVLGEILASVAPAPPLPR